MFDDDELLTEEEIAAASIDDTEAEDLDLGAEGAEEVEGEAEGGEEAETAAEYLNLEELGNRLVKMKVDGEEVELPLSEAIAAGQRQAAFTRKTQELASQRQELAQAATLWEALRANPVETLRVLATNFVPQPEPEFDDPVARQVYDLERRQSAFETQQAQARVDREIEALTAKYGEDFDVAEAATTASRLGVDLSTAQRLVYADKLEARLEAQRVEAERRATVTQQRTEAKREATRVVSANPPRGGVKPASAPIETIDDAINAALAELGVADPRDLRF